jgi:putative DNA primase/helicase
MAEITAETLYTQLLEKDKPPRIYTLSDLGNGRRFADQYRDTVRYCHAHKKFYIFDSMRYAPDDNLKIFQLAAETIRNIYTEASSCIDEKKRAAIARHALSSESSQKLSAMLECAKPYMGVTPDEFDTDPWVLNCQNGVIDLRTGTLSPHDPSSLITKVIPAEFQVDAECPKWEAFIELVTGGDKDLAAFIQAAVGYSLTGLTDEHAVLFSYGLGANGKTTLSEFVLWLMGDYALKTDIESLMLHDKGSSPSPYIARLAGVRYALAAEVPEGRRLHESLVKELSGGDSVTARFLFGQPFTFKPSHKLWVVGNYKPRVSDTSEGFWRRVRIIPFGVTIPTDQRKPMSEILGGFQEEASGILSWAVTGCMMWQSNGLGIAKAVQDATLSYRKESDLVEQFLEDQTELHPEYRVEKARLYGAFKAWCEEAGETVGASKSKKWFSQQLSRRGFEAGGEGRSWIIGLRMKGA